MNTLRAELLQQAEFIGARVPVYVQLLHALADAVLEDAVADLLAHAWSGRAFHTWYDRPLLMLAALRFDARSPERFRGEVEPVDPVAGHIPGARNLPSTAVLAEDGTFLADTALQALCVRIGIGQSAEVGVYCGSGVTASVVVAALSAAGVDAALFPGSWSQWSSEPDRPVARGSG